MKFTTKRVAALSLVVVVAAIALVLFLRPATAPDVPNTTITPDSPSSAPITDSPPTPPTAPPVPSPLPSAANAADLVHSMKVGWNLGNTLDCIDNRKMGFETPLDGITAEEYYETLWGNPVTTPEMIEFIAQAGFGAVRVPVTYADHMDDEMQIHPEWLQRVETVVNYVLDNNMYCIINLHHDTGEDAWLQADIDHALYFEESLRTIWLQLAEHFQDYSDRLLFEGFNEILDKDGNWDETDPSSYELANQLNQVFVDAVRSTGGNNPDRFLVVNTYAAGVGAGILENFLLPTDTAEERLIVGTHLYHPPGFSWPQEDVPWTTAYADWEEARDGAAVEELLQRLKERFVDQGVPVLIGEFGAANKANIDARLAYATHFVQSAKAHGITCFWWDQGGRYENADAVPSATLLDRFANAWFFPELASALVAAAE